MIVFVYVLYILLFTKNMLYIRKYSNIRIYIYIYILYRPEIPQPLVKP